MSFHEYSATFDGEKLESLKAKTKICVETNDFEMRKFIINCSFIHAYCVDNKVVNKLDFIRTRGKKFKINFKANT